MSENTQNNNTQIRNRVQANMSNHLSLKVEYSGDLYIVPEVEHSRLLKVDARYTELEKAFEMLKLKNVDLEKEIRNKLRELDEQQKAYAKIVEKTQILEAKNGALENELSRYKMAYQQLQMEHGVLQTEYNKFKTNMGGRSSVLTEQEQLKIKGWALQGNSVKSIYEEVARYLEQEGQGRTVSYETVRRIVSEVKPKSTMPTISTDPRARD